MVPKWHFILRSILWAMATIILALLAVYGLSFILFAMRETGLVFAPLFGWSGIMLLVVSSPWILIGAVLTFMLVLYILVSRYSFSYQKPLVYSMIGLVLLVIGLSSLIQTTTFHHRAGEFMSRHDVPGLALLYRGIDEHPTREITRGTVSKLTESDFVLTTKEGTQYTVRLTERTRFPQNTKLTNGNTVYVFGPIEAEYINAFGIRIDTGNLLPPPPDGAQKPPRPRERNISPTDR